MHVMEVLSAESHLSNFFYISQRVSSPGNGNDLREKRLIMILATRAKAFLDPASHLDDVVVETVVELPVDAHHGVVEEQSVLKTRRNCSLADFSQIFFKTASLEHFQVPIPTSHGSS